MSKKILITGGAGFIAHHVIDKIMSTTDWEIITIDRLDFSGNLNRLKEVVSAYPESEQKRVRIVHHDLKAELNPEISASIGKVDFISHLAAGSHVDRSISFPLELQIFLIMLENKIVSKGSLTSVLMKYLAQHLMVFIIRKMIDIIQPILTQLQKPELKN